MNKLAIAIFFAISSIIMFFCGCYMHELNHQQIYEDYGIESSIHFGFPAFYVMPVNVTQANQKCNDICNLAQEIDDSVGYNLQAIWGTLVLGIFFMLLLMDERREKELKHE